jgi:hypothetical protein
LKTLANASFGTGCGVSQQSLLRLPPSASSSFFWVADEAQAQLKAYAITGRAP